MNIEVEWSGMWPTYCEGEWTMVIDGVKVDYVPFNTTLGGIPAGTFGTYQSWYFDENYMEQVEFYESGMLCDEWCDVNSEWLADIAPQEEWAGIYKAFQEKDWRFGECGGCI